MRIAVTGSHGTGKTTLVEELCEHLPGHSLVDEPYILLADEGYAFEHPPSVDDFWTQFRRGLHSLHLSSSRIVFDRTPLDFLAYLMAVGVDVDALVNKPVLRSALESLDLLVIVPVTTEVQQGLPRPELPRLRAAMNEVLLELVYDDPLDVCRGVHTIELNGRLDGRVTAVLAALQRLRTRTTEPLPLESPH